MTAHVEVDAVPAVVEVFAVDIEGVDIVEGDFLSHAEMGAHVWGRSSRSCRRTSFTTRSTFRASSWTLPARRLPST